MKWALAALTLTALAGGAIAYVLVDRARSGNDSPPLIVIGDSISDGCCAPEDEQWPELVASALGARAVNLGEDGATSGDLLYKPRRWSSGREQPQIDEAIAIIGESDEVAGVTFQIGFNDFLPLTDPETGISCYVEPTEACRQDGQAAIGEVRRNVDTALSRLREAIAPNTPLVVITMWWGGCDELLNEILKDAAATYDAVVAPICERFEGRHALLLAPDGIHQNARGHEVIADAILEAWPASR
jgi:lysophospholipase L1-like esterase